MVVTIGLLGATGKMGRVVSEVADQLDIELLKYSRSSDSDIKNLYQNSDVIIDFSVGECVEHHIALAEQAKKPLLICTTGHKDLRIFNNRTIPIAYCPNTCIEWILIKELVHKLAKLNPNYTITIDDIHGSNRKPTMQLDYTQHTRMQYCVMAPSITIRRRCCNSPGTSSIQ
jgi:4-hydroxy-tetrahydrodipicolinate reductase